MEADVLSRIPWDRGMDQDAVQSVMTNAITNSNILVEFCAGSTLTVSNCPNNTSNYKMTTKGWIEAQAKEPVILELVQLLKDKRL